MKKIILYITASLDGRIAEPDGGLEWLTGFPKDCSYKNLLASIDTIIMGGRTYREFLNMDVTWSYLEKATYVVTRGWTEKASDENIQFITDNVIETISALRNEPGKDIWLVGGGKLVSMLLEADLIDEMQICYIPKILGRGIPLFPEQSKESTWELTDSTIYKSNTLLVKYRMMN